MSECVDCGKGHCDRERCENHKCVTCGVTGALQYSACDNWLCPILLMERIRSRTIINEETGCHIFTGALFSNGYGHIGSGGKSLLVHRVAYEALIGKIPVGLQLDHIREKCISKACWNPDHLEPVTHQENNKRHFAQYETCSKGHSLVFIPSKGRRGCRVCRAASEARRKSRIKLTLNRDVQLSAMTMGDEVPRCACGGMFHPAPAGDGTMLCDCCGAAWDYEFGGPKPMGNVPESEVGRTLTEVLLARRRPSTTWSPTDDDVKVTVHA